LKLLGVEETYQPSTPEFLPESPQFVPESPPFVPDSEIPEGELKVIHLEKP
jgi:hypothetical protein